MDRETLLAVAEAAAYVHEQLQLEIIATEPPTGPPPIVVESGGDLQAALNSAVSGQTIELPPGAVFLGNYIAPVKVGDAPVYLRTQGTLPTGRISLTANLATL